MPQVGSEGTNGQSIANAAFTRIRNTAPGDNRLNAISNPARSFGYDNAGNTTSDSTSYTSTYNLAGRLTTLTKAGTTSTYSYDANGKRVRKFTSSGSSSTVIFVYDQSGQILGEYDQSGNALREYVWLGSTPVGMFTPDPTSTNPPLVYFIHADHLDTPRVVVDKANAIRWRWLAEPFGTTAPETNPQSLGAFTQNLRFPGQYADQESGLSYNFFRDYDSSTGRYVQSDPIGLGGGINTYTYVLNNPLSLADPLGLDPWGRENPDPWYPREKKPPFQCRPDGQPWGWGCGDKDTDHRVPDVVGGVNLIPACRKHDACYDASKPGASKASCDQQFKADIYSLCRQAGRGDYFCSSISYSYFKGVDIGGGDAWNAAKGQKP